MVFVRNTYSTKQLSQVKHRRRIKHTRLTKDKSIRVVILIPENVQLKGRNAKRIDGATLLGLPCKQRGVGSRGPSRGARRASRLANYGSPLSTHKRKSRLETSKAAEMLNIRSRQS